MHSCKGGTALREESESLRLYQQGLRGEQDQLTQLESITAPTRQ